MPQNGAAAVARGNKRKAVHAQLMRKNGVIEQQRKVRHAVNVTLNYA